MKKTRKTKPKAATSTPKPAQAIFPSKLLGINSEAIRAATTDRAHQTEDGFDNFVSRVGLNNDNALSASFYAFNLMTKNRIQLEAAYRGSWVVGAVIDSIAEDMTRAGIDVTTNEGEEDIKDFMSAFSRLQIWQAFCDGTKWGRLYGGAIGVLQVDGQSLASPLNLETVGKGQFTGISIFDRWQVNPILDQIIQDGPEMGLPKYYDIVTTSASGTPSAETTTGLIRVHHSRVIRFIGIKLPFFQAITEQLWGESVLERMWDRLIAFDNVTMSSASLVDRANLRTIGIEGLREIIAAGGDAVKGLVAQFEMMRLAQVNEGLTLMDKNDTFAATAYSFAGLSDMMLQFGQQLSGSSQTPMVRLFGQSPAGLNSSGDADIRMYYDSINAKQEASYRRPMEVLTKVLWRSQFGKSAPKDLEFSFTPLWQMSAMDKATIGKTNAESVIGAYSAGLVDTPTAMQELRAASGDTGLFSNISDESIKEAELDPPPLPESNVKDPGEAEKPVPIMDSEFKEGDHPRKDDGKFGKGSGNSGSESDHESKPAIHEKDKDAAIDALGGEISNKDWDAFMDGMDAAFEKAEAKTISAKEASKIKKSHNLSFETDPDNEELHKTNKAKRGKDVEDPSIILNFGGELYALDGQHRLNRAIAKGDDTDIAIIDGDFLKKFGVTKETFANKKSFAKDSVMRRIFGGKQK